MAQPRGSDNLDRRLCLCCMIGILAVWNASLMYSQQEDILELETLRKSMESLTHRRKNVPEVRDEVLARPRREVDEDQQGISSATAAPITGTEESVPNIKKQKKKGNKSKRKQSAGAHFTPNPDKTLEEGIAPDMLPVWKPLEWVDKSFFHFQNSTNRVRVKHNAIYIVYGKILMFGKSYRKSFGIYVNDNAVPLAESLEINKLLPPGKISLQEEDLITGGFAADDGLSGPDVKLLQESYAHCSTTIVVHLRKNDEVYIKFWSINLNETTIITQSDLTYWGIAKL